MLIKLTRRRNCSNVSNRRNKPVIFYVFSEEILQIMTDCVNENGKNKYQLCCVRCKSKILPPNEGIYKVSTDK